MDAPPRWSYILLREKLQTYTTDLMKALSRAYNRQEKKLGKGYTAWLWTSVVAIILAVVAIYPGCRMGSEAPKGIVFEGNQGGVAKDVSSDSGITARSNVNFKMERFTNKERSKP